MFFACLLALSTPLIHLAAAAHIPPLPDAMSAPEAITTQVTGSSPKAAKAAPSSSDHAATSTTSASTTTPQGMRWQDYEQPGYLLSMRPQYEATELALINCLQSLIAQDEPPDQLIESYLQRLVSVAALQGKYDSAIQYCELALRFADRLHSDARQQSMLHSTMGKLYGRAGKLTQAELEYARAIDLIKNDSGASDDLRKTQVGLAEVLTRQKRFEEAERLFRKALSQGRTDAFPPELVSFAHCLSEQGKNSEALTLLTEALEIDRHQLGDGQPALAADLNDLACLLVQQKRLPEAEQCMVEAVNICRHYKYPDLADWLHNLQFILQAEGKKEQADRIQVEIDKSTASIGSVH